MHGQRAFITELEPSTEVTLRATHAFGHGVHFAAFSGKKRKDAIGFTELAAAQDDGVSFIRATLGQMNAAAVDRASFSRAHRDY